MSLPVACQQGRPRSLQTSTTGEAPLAENWLHQLRPEIEEPITNATNQHGHALKGPVSLGTTRDSMEGWISLWCPASISKLNPTLLKRHVR